MDISILSPQTRAAVVTLVEKLTAAENSGAFGTVALEVSLHGGQAVRIRQVDEQTFPVTGKGGK